MGTIWKKKKQNEAEREKKRKDERKVLTLTGLLMEGVADPPIFAHCKKKATSSLIAVARPRMKKGREDICMLSH
jgi:hypothetical protein